MLSSTDVLGLIARPFLFAIYGLSGLFPRDPRIWVFGSWSGQRFADNSAALFEYTNSLPQSDITAVWISHDRAIVERLRKRGYEAYHAWSLGGLRATSRAGVLIYDGLAKDINYWMSRGAKMALLRHGIGIKKIERSIDNKNHRLYQFFHGNPLQKLLWHILIPWHRVRPDFCIATSEDHAKQGQDYFGIGSERMVITGFPRNDSLIADKSSGDLGDLSSAIARARDSDRRVWLYMPTFRDHAGSSSPPLEALERLAKDLGILLIVKLHFVDGKRKGFAESEHSSSVLHVDTRLDAQGLYPLVDGLISDYSSASFDFILTGKPVILFTPDMEDYLAHSRSFYYDFEAVRPGPHTRTLDELRTAIVAANQQGSAAWQFEYDRALNQFHKYRDGCSCKRVFEAIYESFVEQDEVQTDQLNKPVKAGGTECE